MIDDGNFTSPPAGGLGADKKSIKTAPKSPKGDF